jgi:hypothetical protein
MVVFRLLDEGFSAIFAVMPTFISFFSTSMSAAFFAIEHKVNPQAWAIYTGTKVTGRFPVTEQIIFAGADEPDMGYHYIEPKKVFEHLEPKLKWINENVKSNLWQFDNFPIAYINPMNSWIMDPTNQRHIDKLNDSWYLHTHELEYTLLFKRKRDAVLFKISNM